MRDYSLEGRTYRYCEAEPLYPFGYGLTYTAFAYRAMKTERDTIRAGETLPVSVEVANVGERRSDEVVQLYARFPDSKVPRPRLSLVGFQRVPIDAGTAETVRLGVRADDLAFWDEACGQFVLEPGRVELLAGPSSATLPLATAITAVG
jgi:beta-glucosidase